MEKNFFLCQRNCEAFSSIDFHKESVLVVTQVKRSKKKRACESLIRENKHAKKNIFFPWISWYVIFYCFERDGGEGVGRLSVKSAYTE